jgi:hypothetical protein
MTERTKEQDSTSLRVPQQRKRSNVKIKFLSQSPPSLHQQVL